MLNQVLSKEDSFKVLGGFLGGIASAGLALWFLKRKERNEKGKNKRTLIDCIGKTPLVYLPRLSQALGS